MYRVKLLDSAIRDLSSLDKATAQRIMNRLRWLAENFDELQRDMLKGDFSDYYKFRVGGYRVLYQVLDDSKTFEFMSLDTAARFIGNDRTIKFVRLMDNL